jgi:hypothetical protein
VGRGVRPDARGDTAPPADPPAYTEADVRAAVGRSLAVLWQGVEGHAEHRTCFSCHNHGAPMLAFAAASGRGFAVPDRALPELVEYAAGYLEANRENLLRGRGPGPLGLGGATDTTGWLFFALEAGGKRPEAATAAAVEYTLKRDASRDHWAAWGPPRPPAETSAFTATALALRGLRAFGLPEHKERIDRRVAAARGWLVRTPAADTEDRVFRLIGLEAAGAAADDVRRAAAELAAAQRADSGWGQTDGMASDAYATGSALVALRTAGGVPADDPVYRRGVAYLLRTQLADGSWHVRSRAVPFQPYYESGFPHGRDQFISCAATGWAAAALAMACRQRFEPEMSSGLTESDAAGEPDR